MSDQAEHGEEHREEHRADQESHASEGAPHEESGPDMRTFCMVWQRCNSAREVADATGMKVASCMTRASKYRNLGVDLKKFPKGRPRKDRKQEIAQLNALLATILVESEAMDEEDESVDVVREILAGLRA